MIAIDSNILVYARRDEAPHHPQALALLTSLAEGSSPWAIPWPCVYEFLRIVTHPRVFDPPTPSRTALEDLVSLLESPSLIMLGEGPAHIGHLSCAIRDGQAAGNLIHDAHIAALCAENGVTELLTADRDLARFSRVRVRNPFGT
jgi:toxin-antitoxin system PIN domain toxin